jgi:hypothetical protein
MTFRFKIFLIILALIFIYCLFTNKIKEKIINNYLNNTLPPGNWKDKCELINWVHPFLWATCYDDLMHPHNSSINVNTCIDNNVHVQNGHLDCH